MMDLKLAHAITIISMFATCFLACILPSVVHLHAEPHSRKKKLFSALKRYCNCLSGGVFAGAFFTQFYPHVVAKFAALLPDPHSIWRHPLQLGPTIVFLGFVMTGLLERLVSVVLARLRQQRTRTESSAGNQELSSASEGPLVLDEEDDEHSVDTDPLSPQTNPPVSAPVKNGHHHGNSRSSSATSRQSHTHSRSGHHHHHHHAISFDEYQGTTRFVVLVASLGTHSIFEGVALGLITEIRLLFNMFFSIVVHEVLMALALGISLSHQKMKLRSRVAFCLVFSIVIPVGQGIGLLIQQAPPSTAGTATIAVLQAIAAGTFLHVMFMEILPQEMDDKFGLMEALWIIAGYLLIPLTSLAAGGEIEH